MLEKFKNFQVKNSFSQTDKLGKTFRISRAKNVVAREFYNLPRAKGPTIRT